MLYVLLSLLGMHKVMFNANDDVTSILQRTKHESTTLATYSIRCVIDANARQCTSWISSTFCLEYYHKKMDT
jgi:hypothetical protein